MKTTILKFFTLSVAIFAFSTISFGQQSQKGSATSSVTIIKPLTITNVRDLVFGSIVSSSTNPVTVTALAEADASVTATGFGAEEGNPLSVASDTRTSAQFDITGEANQAFSVDLPDSVDMEGPGGSTMTVSLDMNLATSNNVLEGGVSVLYVGGSFTIPANQTAGAYSKEFNVTVAYE